MVHLVRKKKNDKTYLYLRQNHRVNGISRKKWQAYLGPEHRLDKLKEKLDMLRKPQSIKTSDFVFPAVLLGIAKKLDLVNIINKHTSKRIQGLSVGEYMLIATLNRCIKPTSKNQIQKWFDKTYLRDEFPQINTYLNSSAYSNHFKYLNVEIIANIEADIHKKLISEYAVDMSSLFYDPTNFYTFINPDDDQLLPKHGHSKEGRKSLNIVNLSLFCSNDGGIPIMHKTYPGNIHDATHFKTELPRFLERMKEMNINSDKIVLIFDKGNISDEFYQELEASDLKFICSMRPSTQKLFHHLIGDDFEVFELPNKKKVGVKEFAKKIKNRVYRTIVSFEPSRNKWYGSNLIEKLDKYIAEMDNWFPDRLNKKDMWSEKDRVLKKILSIIKEEHLPFIDYSIEGPSGKLKLTYSKNQTAIDKHYKALGKS